MHTILPLPNVKSLVLSVLSIVTLCACHPSERPMVADTTLRQQEPKVEVDLNTLCNHLSDEMQHVDQQRTFFALQQINQDLKLCLPLMTSKQQFELLELSHQMYQRFLTIDRNPEQQAAFEQYVKGAHVHPTIRQQHFEHMTTRDQYLVKHQGQSYVELMTLANGDVRYRRSPQYLARIFAPYLPEAEQNFIYGLAHQNSESLLDHQSIKIEALTVAERALFWEAYLNTYPNSRYKTDAQYLYQAYSQLLFMGTQQTNPTSSDHSALHIHAETLAAIEYVSQQSSPKLAAQATKFLDVIQRDISPSHMYFKQEQKTNLSAIRNELGLVQVNFQRSKNCFLDAVCI